MSGKQGGDTTLGVVIGFVLVVLMFIASLWFFAPQLLKVWTILRVAQLAIQGAVLSVLTFGLYTESFSILGYIWDHPPRTYGQVFHLVNRHVALFYMWLALPFVWIGYRGWQQRRAIESSGKYSIEEYLDVVHRRFPWLGYVLEPTRTTEFTWKWPFFKKGQKLRYLGIEFREGLNAYEWVDKNLGELSARLEAQLGPPIKRDAKGAIQWQDPWCKRVVSEALRMIPEPKNPQVKDKAVWRKQAWATVTGIHHYERTLAIGTLQVARSYGVISPVRFLYLRYYATIRHPHRESAFVLWRAICSLGPVGQPSTAHPEAAGILGHFMYEQSLFRYRHKHGADKTSPLAMQLSNMGKQIYVANARDALQDLHQKYQEAFAKLR